MTAATDSSSCCEVVRDAPFFAGSRSAATLDQKWRRAFSADTLGAFQPALTASSPGPSGGGVAKYADAHSSALSELTARATPIFRPLQSTPTRIFVLRDYYLKCVRIGYSVLYAKMFSILNVLLNGVYKHIIQVVQSVDCQSSFIQKTQAHPPSAQLPWCMYSLAASLSDSAQISSTKLAL